MLERILKMGKTEDMKKMNDDIVERLKRGEMNYDSYINYVKALKKVYHIKGDPEFLGESFIDRNNLLTKKGLQNDYIALNNLSENAKRDIYEFQKLKDDTEKYVKIYFGEKEVTRNKAFKEVESYLNTRLKYKKVDENRKLMVISEIFSEVKDKINIVPYDRILYHKIKEKIHKSKN